MQENTNTAAKLETLNDKVAQLKEAKKAVKEAKARREWEAKTKARNSQYVVGSLRRPTEADEEELVHCHGWVCLVTCETCGVERVVNKQDAFQVRFCKEHRAESRKAAAKTKRAEKALKGKSVEDVEAELEKLQAELADLS